MKNLEVESKFLGQELTTETFRLIQLESNTNIGRSDKQQLWSVHGEIWFIFVIQKSDIALGMGWINNPKKLEN